MIQQETILHNDGIALYYSNALDSIQKERFYKSLMSDIIWENESVVLFGKTYTIKRKVAFYSDHGINYTYSNKTKNGRKWNSILIEIKEIIESITKESYNACLLNLYHDGNEGMGWHSDNEKEIVSNSSIASLSLGAERNFSFKHKESKEKITLKLGNGSLLEMKGTIQNNWLHSLPKSKKISDARINLTFRRFRTLN